jgi:hypothetical protein
VGYPILHRAQVPPELIALALNPADACPTLVSLIESDRK